MTTGEPATDLHLIDDCDLTAKLTPGGGPPGSTPHAASCLALGLVDNHDTMFVHRPRDADLEEMPLAREAAETAFTDGWAGPGRSDR